MLEAVFGDDAVRRLAKRAKTDLDTRIEALMAAELQRFHQVLDAVPVDGAQAEEIRRATAAVAQARAGEHPAVTARQQVDLSITEPKGLGRGPTGSPYALEQPPVEDGIVDAEIIERQTLEGPRHG